LHYPNLYYLKGGDLRRILSTEPRLTVILPAKYPWEPLQWLLSAFQPSVVGR